MIQDGFRHIEDCGYSIDDEEMEEYYANNPHSNRSLIGDFVDGTRAILEEISAKNQVVTRSYDFKGVNIHHFYSYKGVCTSK